MQTIHTPILSNRQILDRCDRLLEELEELLLGIEPMSAEEIRRTATAPSDADDFVLEITRVCTAFGLQQLCEATTIADASQDMALARALRAVIERHDRVRGRLHSWRITSASRGWRSTLSFYALLQRMAREDGALREALEPAKEFFRPRRKPHRVARHLHRLLRESA